MIAFLSGTVFEKETKSVLLEVQGVGYRVFCPLSILAHLQKDDQVVLYTYHHIREDDLSLFGFQKKQDLQLFTKLISVSGIGPKTGLDIMEVSSSLLLEALETSDVKFLQSIKGIGKKTAERMILELRGNLPELETSDYQIVSPEVMTVLQGLGFEKSHIHHTFKNLKNPLPSAEEMVKWFLQNQTK